MDRLPDELLLNVFSYFKKLELEETISLVCQRWRLLAQDSSLWRSLLITCPTTDTSAGRALLQRHQYALFSLSLDITHLICMSSFLRGMVFSRLTYLDMSLCILIQPICFLKTLEAACPCLVRWTMADYHLCATNDADVQSLQGLPKLSIVDMDLNQLDSTEFQNVVGYLSRQCPRLERIQIRVHIKCQVSYLMILATCSSLRHLDLIGACIDDLFLQALEGSSLEIVHLYRAQYITRSGLTFIAQSMPQLTSLHVHIPHSPLSTEDFIHFFRTSHFTKLTDLVLVHPSINDQVLQHMSARYGSTLQECHILQSPTTGRGIQMLMENCVHLRHVSFKMASRVQNPFVNSLSRAWPRIETISIDYVGPDPEPQEIQIQKVMKTLRPSMLMQKRQTFYRCPYRLGGTRSDYIDFIKNLLDE